MVRSASAAFLGKEFDEFLQAPIGEDKNGMLLSVLSALARLDVDPWEEATKLARLPGEAATRQLTLLLARLPAGPSVRLDLGAIAARLITLLPRQGGFKIPSGAAPPARGMTINPRTVLLTIFIFFMLVAQLSIESRRQSPTDENVRTPPSATYAPHTPPPGSRP